MVAIPTHIVVGGPNLNGPALSGLVPQPGNKGAFWTNANNQPKLMQLVPTTGTAFTPWWDGYAGTQLTIATANSTTVTVTGAPWTAGSEVGKTVYIDTGAAAPTGGIAMRGVVTLNTTNQLTISGTWQSANTANGYWALNPSNPTSGKLHIANGAWVTYNHMSGRDVFTTLGPVRDNYGTNGDNWYADGQGGFGWTASLIQELKDLHPTAPWFRLFKWANVGGLSVWGNNASVVWLGFVAEWARALAAYGADTPDYRSVTIDASIADIVDQNGGFGIDLINFVVNIRALLGAPNLLVIVHVHASGLYAGPTAQGGSNTIVGGLEVPYTNLIRAASNKLRTLITNFRIVDWEGSEFSSDSIAQSIGVEFLSIAPGTISPNPLGYSTPAHIAAGIKTARTIAAFYAEAPAIPPGGGIPVVVLLGDSQGLSVGNNPFIAILGDQPSLLGPVPGINIMGAHRIWDGQNHEWVPYDLSSNSNTVGVALPEYFGPDATLLRRIGEAFPNGCLIFKMAIGGASVTFEAIGPIASATFDPMAGDLWDTATTEWNAARLAAVRDLGLIPETLAVCNLLGDNDTVPAAAAAFVDRFEAFVEAERTLFRTRPIELGGQLPIIFALPPKHVDNGGQSIHGDSVSRELVRNRLIAYKATDSRFGLLDEDDLELRRDQVHYGGEAVYELGVRFGDAVLSFESAAGGATGGGDETEGVIEDKSLVEDKGLDAPLPEPTSEQLAALVTAMHDSPDIASYKTPSGLEVVRRDLKTQMDLVDWLQRTSARANRVRQTRVSFY